ncbi:hypothetical protein ElyMa_001001800 [Elysia marginata]|uniref:Uncharacterized protein n=1 Tax=Elysia marginata TaxID=1093978 RepID=A0AAV4HJG8_9GAST|nr:hypothetical protein ElyMa_001001800 [Elysia marginata]
MASTIWTLCCDHRAVPLHCAWRPLRRAICHVLVFINVQVTCSLFLILTFALTPTLGASSDTTTRPKLGNSLNMMNANGNGSGTYGEFKSPNNSSFGNNLTGGQKLFNSRAQDFPSLKLQNENVDSSQSSSVKNQTLPATNAEAKTQQNGKNNANNKKKVEPRSSQNPVSGRREIKREFPVALVTAASVAAFCILLFFLLAYIWHTKQLDSRARKLAIRLAADAEEGRRAMGHSGPSCRNCGSSSGGRIASSSSSGRYTLAPPLVRPDSISSSHDKGQYEPLTCTSTSIGGGLGIDADGDRVIGPDSISGRSSVGVSESEAGDSEDVFEPACSLPVIPPDRLRGLRSGGRGAHRKWSRSKKGCSGSASFEKRDSAVTDKEILTHFASRRHSTFFI